MRIFICSMLVLSACAHVPSTMGEQAKALDSNKARIGKVDAEFHAVGDGVAWSSRKDDSSLTWKGYDGTTICVVHKDGAQFFPSHSTEEQDLAEWTAAAESTTVAWAAYDSLAAVPATFGPKPDAKGTVTEHSLDSHATSNSLDESTSENKWLNVTIEWCAPAPAMTGATRYLALSAYGEEGTTLFLWEVQRPVR